MNLIKVILSLSLICLCQTGFACTNQLDEIKDVNEACNIVCLNGVEYFKCRSSYGWFSLAPRILYKYTKAGAYVDLNGYVHCKIDPHTQQIVH